MTAYSVDVRADAPVMDTEVADRVARAVRNVFPEADVEVTEDRVVATTHDVERFRELLREQRILDTARSHLLEAVEGDTIAFALKKQVALQGKVNFAVGNPAELGDVHVEMRVRDPDPAAFVDYLAPRTDEDGNPVEPE